MEVTKVTPPTPVHNTRKFSLLITLPVLDVLEIGSGTGLLSFTLAPHVNTLIGVDTAEGMISAFNTKLSDMEATPNLCAINHFLEDPDSEVLQNAAESLGLLKPHRFELVVSHLTLHHIASLEEIFGLMYRCLKPGGIVALTDYEDFGKEAIRFHPEAKRPGVEHHGIKKELAREMLEKVGFEDVRVEEVFVLKKEVDEEEGYEKLGGREMEFPFLMVFGSRGDKIL
jgi:SAM-dependent methyltransferase